MPKFSYLIKGVCGIQTQKRLDSRPLPQSVTGWTPVALAHDRRLAAGIFTTRRRPKWRRASRLYRIVVWRTYRTRNGEERASTSLHRDEIDPALSLLAKCGDRMPTA